MFYLLIGLTPLNCMQPSSLCLYVATVFYWVLTLIPRTVLTGNTNPE